MRDRRSEERPDDELPDAPTLPDRLDRLVEELSGSWTMPLSGTVLADGAELLALVEDVKAAVPAELYRARDVLAEAEAAAERAAGRAEAILGAARDKAAALVDEHAIVEAARTRADQILADADARVADRLAEFEAALGRLTARVRADRDHLSRDQPGRDHLSRDQPGRDHPDRAGADASTDEPGT